MSLLRPSIDDLSRLVEVRGGAVLWRTRIESDFRRAIDCGRWNSRFAGQPAGSPNSNGYVLIGFTLEGSRVAVKRSHVVWALAAGFWPAQAVDHANGIRDDDRIENLRLASAKENARNTATAAGVSGVRGVYKSRSGWSSLISTDGGRVFLGQFGTIEEAGAAYEAAARAAHGDFAHHHRVSA